MHLKTKELPSSDFQFTQFSGNLFAHIITDYSFSLSTFWTAKPIVFNLFPPATLSLKAFYSGFLRDFSLVKWLYTSRMTQCIKEKLRYFSLCKGKFHHSLYLAVWSKTLVKIWSFSLEFQRSWGHKHVYLANGYDISDISKCSGLLKISK